MPSARHRRHPRHRRPSRRRAPVVAAAVLVAGCGVWGWSTREAPPSPSVASAPASDGGAASEPGGAGARTPRARTTSTPEQDARLVQGLVVLDAQAVAMADALDGADPEVADLAERIRDEDDPDLGSMVDWLRADRAAVPEEADDPAATDPDAHPDLPGGISGNQLSALEEARGSNADRLFLGLLLSHDEATVAMVDAHARATTDDGVRSIAASVSRARTARIAEVTAMLERLT